MADSSDRQALLSALTTEHFTLQSAKASTISDSSSRSSLYLGSVSSALIALAFIGQISALGQIFFLFGLTVLPTLFFLGLVTYVRVLQSMAEDVLYARSINRIRRYYAKIEPGQAHYFAFSGGEEGQGTLTEVVLHYSRWQLLFTTASTIAVINSVVGGVAVALTVSVAMQGSLFSSILSGIVFGAVAIAIHLVHQFRHIQTMEAKIASLWASDQDAASDVQT